MYFFVEDQCVNSTVPATLSFATAGVTTFLCLITVPGNLLVVLAVFIDPNKELRSPFNYFVANLAMADLLVGIVTEPVAVIYYIQEGMGLRDAGSPEIHMPFFISCTASILSLLTLTLDRYVAITSPFKYKALLNPGRAAILCGVVWIVSLGFPFLYFHIGYIPYAFLFANTAILLTFIVLLFAYIRIYKIFRDQVKAWDNLHAGTDENLRKKMAVRWEQKITKTFLIMLSLFVLCYMSACAFIYLLNLCDVCSCLVMIVSRNLQFLLILSNSCMNPFVYSWRLRNYRRAFLYVITFGQKGISEAAKLREIELRSFRKSSLKTSSLRERRESIRPKLNNVTL